MARILVLNPYDFECARGEVAAGRSPDQVLHGLNHFERHGHEVTVVPFRGSVVRQGLNRVTRRSPVPLGDFDQQYSAWREVRQADLIYCANQNVGQSLGYLRAAGRLARPLVWVVHHPLDCGRLSRARRPLMRRLLRGVDAYPALTAPVARDLAAIAGTDERTRGLSYGPDPDWYPTDTGLGRGVVAAGNTKRDLETFARAASQTEVPATIVCPKQHAPRAPAGPNTRLISFEPGRRMSHLDLVEIYAQARALAIPLHVRWPWSMNGLQGIADALGMGKPMIVTRNPWLDIDVEALGIGIWVAPGDIEGWRNAIEYLDQNPEVATEMGRRARALVDDGTRSSATYARELMQSFDAVLQSAG
ncbi:MAG: glycosyltransferase [Solirubrobacteraceae bacterium]